MAVAAVERKDTEIREGKGGRKGKDAVCTLVQEKERKREKDQQGERGDTRQRFFSVSDAVFHPPSGSAQLHRAATSLSFLASRK